MKQSSKDSALVEQTGTAAESLVDQANALSDVVNVFKFEHTSNHQAQAVIQERRKANSRMR